MLIIRAMSTRAARPWAKSVTTRRLAWVMALALLLPFAQALAWVHTLSHHGSLRLDASALDSPCAVCLSAAPLAGGALPSSTPVVHAPPVPSAPPLQLARIEPRSAPLALYDSRAPPLSLH
jgi:hypothetical protein